MENLEIWDKPPSPLDQKFWDFHKKNPYVFEELVKMAEKAKSAGRKRISINMMFEVLRWNRAFKTTDKDFKLNNSYRSRYARLISDEHPELGRMFETRSIKS